MKTKAFTLIEILVVLVIIGILSVIVIPDIYKVINKTKINSYNNLINLIEGSAKLYVSQNKDEIKDIILNEGRYIITLEQLVDNNLLKTPIIDPRTDEEISLDKRILVKRRSLKNENVFSYCYEDKDCFVFDTTPPVITLLGDNPAVVGVGEEYVDAGATAFDDVDGDKLNIL